MNIHEHQAKQILKKYGAVVPEGVFALDVDELIEKAKALKTEKYVLKAQIHALTCIKASLLSHSLV
jgi:succinyl-CoA synthetase beta subunit